MTKIGVALPAQTPGTDRADVLAYLEGVERLGFESLWVLDRLVYDSLAPLPLLGAAAAMTSRVRLGTCVLLANLYSPLLLAKEMATIDRLSGGRLTLGVAAGGREVDFAAAGVDFRRRGQRLEETIGLLRQAWRGERIEHRGAVFQREVPPIGPQPTRPGGPPIWVGGRSQAAIERAVRVGDGYLPGRSGPEALRRELERVRVAALAAGRDPDTLPSAADVFFNMDANPHRALDGVTAYLDVYYGPPETLVPERDTVFGTPRQAAERIREFEATGVDTLILIPTSRDPDHLERLAEAVALARDAVHA